MAPQNDRVVLIVFEVPAILADNFTGAVHVLGRDNNVKAAVSFSAFFSFSIWPKSNALIRAWMSFANASVRFRGSIYCCLSQFYHGNFICFHTGDNQKILVHTEPLQPHSC